ncbi:DUF3459 domain-containing protein [Ktedonosporobacter rubrisoli]|uniref:DUF3459 domain-containing protein n=1 Tax=Ktedonosporobacter rubrisoli TaxID=2509675 RepID=A0A4P6JLM2_KTERU|nr:alpha-amylase family glycosyl hydrolase [Ktedonosporobacter rubrisoli]QBD76104.1 DUF3459 domain-containing protein [Ktedonosporobacter rubrisoli]
MENTAYLQATSPVTQPLWWQCSVIYQICVRSFQDSNADGVGDLAGVIKRLDYLKDVLGIDAIWLTPFYPSPMADGGYDVSDYADIDPLFGDLATFDLLVAEAHTRHLRVIIDYVPNHTSDQHPWFIQSRSSHKNPYHNWYVWSDPNTDGSPPNNWLSVFGGSAWSWDATRKQYYLHSFLPQQPDLNWRNDEVKTAMFNVLRFWLERGVDGFRIDVAHFLMKDPLLRNNPLNTSLSPTFWRSFGPYDGQWHFYDQGHPDIHKLYQELHQLLDDYSDKQPRVSIGELHRPDIGSWAAYYGRDLDELHLPFNFRLLSVPWQAQEVRLVVDELESVLPTGAWPNYVLGNHDEPRLASRLGQAQARVAMMLLLTLRGTPTLYYGDELGMQNGVIPPERTIDHWAQTMPGLDLGRDQERTPMLWDGSKHAGFCPPETEPWLPVSQRHEQDHVMAQLMDPCSMLSLTSRLLALRREHNALSIGKYLAIETTAEDCFAFLRQYGSQRFLIVLNFANSEQILDLSPFGPACIILSTHLDREEHLDLDHLTLRGNEGCLIACKA